jgi:hypothetical protein
LDWATHAYILFRCFFGLQQHYFRT